MIARSGKSVKQARKPEKPAALKAEPENVKSRNGHPPKKASFKAEPKLARTTFKTSREMDFFSEKELVTQTGHSIEEWPLVFLKETLDNALDACEEADIAPVITIVADAAGITVSDNGPGLPEGTLKGALDFTVRASNREAYVAPDRGAQGNALKTLLPMAWVVDPDHGKLIVEAHDKRHTITCGADPVSQRAVVHDDVSDAPTSGTTIRIEWSPRTIGDEVVWPFDDIEPCDSGMSYCPGLKTTARRLVEGFAVFNPHLTLTLDWFGDHHNWTATDPDWRKWRPNQPTSIHWYELAHFGRLIGAYITHDRDHGADRLVSDLVAEFDGLTGSQKRAAVLRETDLKRVHLSDFVVGGQLDSARIDNLRLVMRKHTRPVKPKRLGPIGEDHLRERLLAMGVQPESICYTRKLAKDGLPWVLESAFGWKGDESEDDRTIFAGANWSSAIKNPFRSFGSTGEGLEAVLTDLRAGAREPIVYILHLAHPRVEYTDRGKSALVISGKSKI